MDKRGWQQLKMYFCLFFFVLVTGICVWCCVIEGQPVKLEEELFPWGVENDFLLF